MLTLSLISAFFCIVLVVAAIYLSQLPRFRNKEALRIQRYHQELDNHGGQLNYITSHVLPFTDAYCSKKDIDEKASYISANLPPLQAPKRYSGSHPLHEKLIAIKAFQERGEKLRGKHNAKFVKAEAERSADFFKSILPHPLDAQQIDAILHEEDNTLIIAGAGCGKTTTVQGKVSYLIDRRGIDPKKILLLSFAKRNADQLKKKMGHLGVDCRTFHALAYQIVKSTGRPADILAPEEAEQLIREAHLDLLADGAYLASFNDLILNGLRPIRNENEFSTYAEYIQYLKDSEFESLRGMLQRKRQGKGAAKRTLNDEFVKSAEECYLANFLFLNGVSYSYEFPYPFHTEVVPGHDGRHKKRYRPDFTIFLNGRDEHSISYSEQTKEDMLFLEHYGIDAHGNTPQFFSDGPEGAAHENYSKLMAWKEKLHQYHRTRFIKSYSYEFANRSLEENLVSNLLAHAVKISPKSNVQIYDILQQAYGKDIDSVIKLFVTFINLLKSNNRTFEELYLGNSKAQHWDSKMRLRNQNLLELISSVHQKYEQRLQAKQKIDFNDLINLAIEKVKDASYQHPYQYIIVDEFQDISTNRYHLLRELRRQQYYKLFAVGDDWQSIYRFSGSDLTLFSRFEDFFGHTNIKKVETTYRFGEPMIGISSDFILKNPAQKKKKLRSAKKIRTDIDFLYNSSDKHINGDLRDILNRLYQQYGSTLQEKSITLLGRYSHDLRQVTDDDDFNVNSERASLSVNIELHRALSQEQTSTDTENRIWLQKDIPFFTVHSAKGLESDIVILINCVAGKYGFPAELSDDPILELLLSGDDHFANAEERRAFYVALTRAKEKFILLADKSRPSKFVQEIQERLTGEEMDTMLCEKCNAELRFVKEIKKNGRTSLMYGCTNYRYGCQQVLFKNS